MPNNDNNHLERAAAFWRGGQSLEAGRLIFENLPTEVRTKWASRILRLVLDRSGVRCSPIEQILQIADHATEWRNAHGVFSTLRKETLDLEKLQTRSEEKNLLLCHLYLAENVAKVIYNATDPPDEFDEDSGWWIVSCLKCVLDLLNDDAFSKAAWSSVCSEQG